MRDMAEKLFRSAHRVTYAQCTVGNHIYYARYLDILEAVRGEFFRSLGLPLLQSQNEGTIFPVIESHLCYKIPARYDDLLTIEIWLTKLQGVRVNFAYRVRNQDEGLVLEGETFHACAGLNEMPKRIPKMLIGQLQPYLRESESKRIVA